MRYVSRDVEPRDLHAAVSELRSPEVRGANVTIPHKETVVPLMDELAQEAATIGAVNTIVNEDGGLSGHNTDAAGFAATLRKLIPEGPAGRDCLVVGAGGVARAVVASLVGEGAFRVWVANRTHERALRLCEEASEWGTAELVPLRLEDAKRVGPSCKVIVNATSLGLVEPVKEFPVDVDTLDSGQVLVDTVYGTDPTSLVEAARKRGIAAVDGKEMLLQQAALAYELWTGIEAPLKAMREMVDGQ